MPQASQAQMALDQSVQHATTNPGLAGQLKAFGGSLLQGITQGIGTIVRSPIGQGVAGIADVLDGRLISDAANGTFDSNLPQKQAQAAGDAIQRSTDGIIPDALKDTVGGKVGGFVGGITPYIAAGFTGPAAPAVMGAALFGDGYQSQYENAKTKLTQAAQQAGQTVDPEHVETAAKSAGLLGGAINTILALPFAGASGAISKVFGGVESSSISQGVVNAFENNGVQGIRDVFSSIAKGDVTPEIRAALKEAASTILNKTVGDRALAVARTAATNSAIGAGVQIGQNVVAQNLYDLNRGLFDGVPAQAAAFGALGAFHGTLRQVALAREAVNLKTASTLDPVAAATDAGGLLTNGSQPNGPAPHPADLAKPVAGRVVDPAARTPAETIPPLSVDASQTPATPQSGSVADPSLQAADSAQISANPAGPVSPSSPLLPAARGALAASAQPSSASSSTTQPPAAGQASPAPAASQQQDDPGLAALVQKRDDTQKAIDAGIIDPKSVGYTQAIVDGLTKQIDQARQTPATAADTTGSAPASAAPAPAPADGRPATPSGQDQSAGTSANLPTPRASDSPSGTGDTSARPDLSTGTGAGQTAIGNPDNSPGTALDPQGAKAEETRTGMVGMGGGAVDSMYRNLSDQVNAGAQSEANGVAPSVAFQALTRLKAKGATITPEFARDVAGKVGAIMNDPQADRQAALKQLVKDHLPAQTPAPGTSAPSAPSTYEGMVGDKLDAKRTAFSANSGTLGIPREQMPQVAAEHRGAMANFLKARGMAVSAQDEAPSSLRPSQAEFNPAKVAKAAAIRQAGDPNPRRILTSSDGYIVDGHHQFLDRLQHAPDEPMPTLRINAPAKEILSQIHEFPSAGMEKAPDLAPRLQAPAQKGDTAKETQARAFIADGRQMGRRATAGDLTKKLGVNYNRAQMLIAEQDATEQIAAQAAARAKSSPGATPPELLAPEDHARQNIAAFDELKPHVRQQRRLLANQAQASAVSAALEAGRPVNAEAADKHGLVPPAHYTKAGDRYESATVPESAKVNGQKLNAIVARQRGGATLSDGDLKAARALRKNIDIARSLEPARPAAPPAEASAPFTPPTSTPPAPIVPKAALDGLAVGDKIDLAKNGVVHTLAADNGEKVAVTSPGGKTTTITRAAALKNKVASAAPAKASEAPDLRSPALPAKAEPGAPSQPERGAPATSGPRQPTSDLGKRAAREIARLTAKRTADNGFLSPGDLAALAANREILTHELNRQVLGPNPKPTGAYGIDASDRLDELNRARNAGAQLRPGENAEMKRHLATLESDFTAQRQAIEAGGQVPATADNAPAKQSPLPPVSSERIVTPTQAGDSENTKAARNWIADQRALDQHPTPGEVAQANRIPPAQAKGLLAEQMDLEHRAAETLTRVDGHVTDHAATLKALGVHSVRYGDTRGTSGVEMGEDGILRIAPSKLAQTLDIMADNQARHAKLTSNPEDAFLQTLAHEGVHAADFAVARAKHQTIEDRYNGLPAAAMPKGWEAAGAKAYGESNWQGLQDWQKKAEFVRQVVEKKWTGRISEQLYSFIKEAIDFLKGVAGFKNVDPRFQAHVEEIEQHIKESGAQPIKADPFQRPSKLAVENQAKRMRAYEKTAQANPDKADAVERYHNASRQLAEMQRLRALPLQEGETPRTFEMPEAPTGAPDALDHIREQGGMMSKGTASERPNFSKYAGDYDGAPTLRGYYHHAVFRGDMAPDRMAQVLHENHGIGDGSPDGMWKAIDQAVDLRRKVSAQRQAEAVEQHQAARFDKDAVDPATAKKGATPINVESLQAGDKVKIGDQELTVLHVDTDSREVTLEDHSKYGVQKVGETDAEGNPTVLYVEKVAGAPDAASAGDENTVFAPRPERLADTGTGSLFANDADDGFALQPTPTTDAERVQAAKRAASTFRLADLPKLRTGEKGTADLFQGEDQPFNLAGEKGIDHGARQQMQAQADRDTAAARAQQDQQQSSLFAPKPEPIGDESGLDQLRRLSKPLRDALVAKSKVFTARGEAVPEDLNQAIHALTGNERSPLMRMIKSPADEGRFRNKIQALGEKYGLDMSQLAPREPTAPAVPAAPAPDPAPVPTPKAPAPPASFADEVARAANSVPTAARFGGNKVPISRAFDAYQANGGKLDLAAFKAGVAREVATGNLSLSRSDLAGSFDPSVLRRSQTEHPVVKGELYHYIRTDGGKAMERLRSSANTLAAPAPEPLGDEDQGQTPDPKRVGNVASLVKETLSPDAPNGKRFAQYGIVSPAQGASLKAATGLDLTGFRRSLDNSTVRHVMRQHGDPQAELSRGNLPLTRDDFTRLSQWIQNPDASTLAGKNNRGQDVILSAKRINGHVIVAEEVREGNQVLSLSTLYKKSAPPLANGPDGKPDAALLQSTAQATLEQVARDFKFKHGQGGADGGNTLGAAKPESILDDDEAEGTPSRPPVPESLLGRARAEIANQQAKGQLADTLSAHHDAVDTLANVAGRQAGNAIRHLDLPNTLDRQAAGPLVEAGYDPQRLRADLARVQASPDPKLAAKYAPAYQHALDNLPRLRDATANYRQMDAEQDSLAERAGLPPKWQARVKHLYDDPTSPASTLPTDKGFGATPGFKTAADAIAAGVDPRSTDLADLAQRRVYQNQRAINERAFQEGLSSLKASDGKPMVSEIQDSSSKLNADGSVSSITKVPRGYKAVQAGDNVLVAHQEVAPLLEALYGDSALRQHWMGNKALDFAAMVKHGMIGIDTFYGFNTAMRSALGFQVADYRPGLAGLDFADQDLDRAVQAGKVSPKAAATARRMREIDRGMLEEGLNVGKATDNLLEAARQANLIEHIPVVGHAAKATADYVFHQVLPGYMVQAARTAWVRNRARFPKLSEREVSRRSSKEVNEFYNNLGSQGFLKSKTMQDAAKLLLFAPGVTEGRFRTEARGIGQMGKTFADGVRGKGWRVGAVAQAMGTIILGSLIGSQMLNLFTRRKPTWDNPEDGHRWDAWIPGGPHNAGFFFSPLSMAAEYSHELFKYLHGGGSVLDAVSHLASNKLSGPARGVKDLFTGTDWRGQPFASTGERLKAAALDASPLPMQAGAFVEKDPKAPLGLKLNHQPGALERQALGSMGFKVEAAQSARSQMYRTAEPFRTKPLPAYHASGTYTDLRRALDNGDEAGAEDEVRRLLGSGSHLSVVEKRFGIASTPGKGQLQINREIFTNDHQAEHQMLAKLTPAQMQVYNQAQADRQQNAELLAKITQRLRVEMIRRQQGGK